ncbi:MAG: Dabb family protein [Woeseiaceae bacterium]|jgi:hypothetical protein
MIRHIVFFSARSEAEIEPLAESLNGLKSIPAAERIEIAVNEKIDLIANDVDVVVYGEFKDPEALAAYRAHPAYSEAIAKARPLREMRFAADFQSDA